MLLPIRILYLAGRGRRRTLVLVGRCCKGTFGRAFPAIGGSILHRQARFAVSRIFELEEDALFYEQSGTENDQTYVEHTQTVEIVATLASGQGHCLAADSVVAAEHSDPSFQTKCFPAAVDFAVVTAGLQCSPAPRRDLLRFAVDLCWLPDCQKGYCPVEVAAAGYQTVHYRSAGLPDL